jgi:hypothetical protein
VSRSIRLRTASGREILLVPETALRDPDSARHRSLRTRLDDDPFGRLALADAREDSWATSSSDVVVIDLGSAPMPGRPMLYSRDVIVDWDSIPMLSDLIGPRTEPVGPSVPVFQDPMDAWLSFEVVDERGVPADGRYVCSIDGDVNDGPLDRTSHAFRELSTSARGRLRIVDLRWPAWPFEGPTPEGPTPEGPSEPEVDPEIPATRGTSFEVVDEDGVALVGGYRVGDDTGEREGSFGGVIRVETSGTARLRLSVAGPTTTGGSR